MSESNGQKWTLEIKSKTGLFDLNLKEIWQYKDLIYMFVKRDFVAQYKQTILGPLWYIIQPLVTTFLYSIIFGTIAQISTDGQPHLLFYLTGLLLWNFFSSNLVKNSETFLANSGMFGKVYFPRLTVPISTTISGFVALGIQLGLLMVVYIVYLFKGMECRINAAIALFPILMLMVCFMSLSLGIVVSSMTTKYRDLKFLLAFGIQLAMWATPVIYPMSQISDPRLKMIIGFNPMAPIIETFRYSILGSGNFSWYALAYSFVFTVILTMLAVVMFKKVEKDFIDSI